MQFAAGGVVIWHNSFFIMALGSVMLSASASVVLPRIKKPRCPSNRRLNVPHIWCELGAEKNLLSIPKLEHLIVQPVALSLY
jgi:hypothetical protein